MAIDSNYAIWGAFHNLYWPALYVADAHGNLRHHHFGEGGYRQSEVIIQQLLAETGSRTDPELVSVDALGLEAPADWTTLRSPENYTGYKRSLNFASVGGARSGRRHGYAVPAVLRLNQWALSGDWTVSEQAVTLMRPTGALPTASMPAISTLF